MLGLLGLLTVTACSARPGWRRDESRACGSNEPPRVCLLAGPDAQQVVSVGGVALVPGECAAASHARGGRIAVRVRDGRSGLQTSRTIRVRRGETAMISGGDGAAALYERRSCARDDG